MIILESGAFVRNYLDTGVFNLILNGDYEIVVIDAHNADKKRYGSNMHISFIECQYGSVIRYINQLNFDVGIVKNLNKSSSFRYRYNVTASQAISFKTSFSNHRIVSSSSYKKLIKKFSIPYAGFLLVNAYRVSRFFKFCSKIPYKALLHVLSLPYIYSSFQGFRKLIAPCTVLGSAIYRFKPDLVIYPSSAYSIVGEDILRLSKKSRVFKTLFLIDNWDNLSSKSVFEDKPTYLGVWGEQSKEHAIRIQGISHDKIHILGTPRFLVYENFKYKNKEPSSPYEFPYILFLGMGGLTYDEIGALKKVAYLLLENNKLFPKGCKVIYRPHPYGTGMVMQDEFSQLSNDNVILDKQVEEHYYSDIYYKDRNFQPNLDYYPSLLSCAQIVVGGPTTMIMEALLLKKNVVLLAYDDGFEVNLKKQFRSLEHFKGLKNIPSLFLVNDIDDMRTAMLAAHCVEWNEDSLKVIENKVSYYIFSNLSNGTSYIDRLGECISDIEK